MTELGLQNDELVPQNLVLWDYKDLQIPKDCNVDRVLNGLTRLLDSLGNSGTFTVEVVVGDFTEDRLPKSRRLDLIERGVRITSMHITEPEAADDEIIRRIRRWMHRCQDGTLVLMTSDGGYASWMRKVNALPNVRMTILIYIPRSIQTKLLLYPKKYRVTWSSVLEMPESCVTPTCKRIAGSPVVNRYRNIVWAEDRVVEAPERAVQGCTVPEEMLWSIVKSNSKNVVAWHPLISTWRYLINQTEKDYDIAKIWNVYEEYLADFPVCYVHWIKYVEHEVRVGAVENVSKVYGKALLWLSYSVEIWIHYCKFAVDREGEPNTIRKFFEQALDYVGTDFRSAELWSKYIEYESSQNDLSRTINIYTRVLQYPIQHLETFFKEFKDMVAKHDLPETHLAIGQSLYAKAKEIGSKIIAFERVIKTPYFKVDPLDDAELETWHNYLDFIEGEGDQNKVVKLYERCVIVCANYPQYWLRYVLKMETSGLVEHAASAFRRATLMFLDIQSDEQLFTAPFIDSEVAPLLLEAVTKDFRRNT